MTPFRKILVAVDFSDCSRRALALAAELARAPETELFVLHVWKPPEFAGADLLVLAHASGVSIGQHGKQQAEVELSHFLERAGLEQAARDVKIGDPRQLIVELAESGGFDLVVLGTHGRAGRERLFAGSVAEAVVRRCSVPVLTVRSRE